MAKPEKVRITLDDKNEIEAIEVMLNGKWVAAQAGECCSTEEKTDDKVIRVGHIAQPNSCVRDPRCTLNPTLCSIYVGGCYYYPC